MSGMRLYVGAEATTVQLRIVGIKDTVGNATAANPKVLVKIVENHCIVRRFLINT